MNIDRLQYDLTICQLVDIASNLDKMNKQKDSTFNRHHIKNLINEVVLNEYDLRSFIACELPITKVKYNINTILDLKKVAFGVTEIEIENLKILESLGILYHGNLPIEIKDILQVIFREQLIEDVENYQINVQYSIYLRLILLLIKLLNSKNYNLFKKIKEDKYLKIIFSYLISCKIVRLNSNDIELDEYKLKVWFENKVKIYDFHCFFFDNYSYAIRDSMFKFINTMIDIQYASHVWVILDEIKFIIYSYKEEFKMAKELGLIQLIKKNNIEYIKLSDDLWFSMNNKIPYSWESKKEIITPDFQVFLPYYFDPDVIFLLAYYGRIINNPDMLDYLLVFDLSLIENIKGKDNIVPYEKFIKSLKSICPTVPDIVREYILCISSHENGFGT